MAVAEQLVEFKNNPSRQGPLKDNDGFGGGNREEVSNPKDRHGEPSRAYLGALRAKLNTAKDDSKDDGVHETRIGSIQLFNGMKAETRRPKAPSEGLMYIDAQRNRKTTEAMIDTGATHNFVSKDEANRLGLWFAKETGWVKAMNSEAQTIHGTARGVDVRLGPARSTCP
ncbi:hypothetical protein AMTR_s00036p00216240 [Amborella trichopoda]|uniref:Aspartic peptidase DDI1-type domain-containing protein n=1 Tax=Amborella trichopoda TaxID=13333 RepID=U5CZ26_AMBTC|nr:hypothetical protein AMTR_s00036p00216240 [Amborella trichopoda]